MSKYNYYFLQQRINLKYGCLENFAKLIGENTKQLKKKLTGENDGLYIGDIHRFSELLGVTCGNECEAFFFLHTEDEKNVYFKLYSELISNKITIEQLCSMVGIDKDTFFGKIIGKIPFYWEEAIEIRNKLLPNAQLDTLFEKGDEIYAVQ